MAQKKENLIKKNVIERHKWDEQKGKSLINDFLQMSQVAEELKESNERAYTMFMQLIKEKYELEKEVKERGNRIKELDKYKSIALKQEKNKK